MNAVQYVRAMARVEAMPEGPERHQAWRAVKSARQLYLNQKRRERDPVWYQRKLTKVAEYRKTRAANDPDYRRLRNEQSR